MVKDEKGTWIVESAGDLNGTYYTYEAEAGGNTVETVDPYARTTGVNGDRAMVIDLDSADPAGWAADQNVYEYYKGLIAFRKAHGALRLTSAADITAHVHPVDGLPANVVAFQIDGGVNGETAGSLYVIFNPNKTEQEIALPAGTWNVYINGEKAGTEILETVTDGAATVAPISALVLTSGSAATNPDTPDTPDTSDIPSIPGFPGTSGNSGASGNSGNSNKPGAFTPDGATNRGMIATILYRLAGEPQFGSDLSAFDDVMAGAYYADAVYWAVAKGVAKGYGDGTFGPGDAISRQDLAVMLWRYAGEPASAASLTGWPDAGSVSGYARTAMAWCIENGLINGSDGKLDPRSNATRSQVAAIIMRFCQNIAE